MRIGWVIYGDLNLRTGGFFYDRQVVRGLRARGHTVDVVALPWRRPWAAALAGLLGWDRLPERASQWDVVVEDALVHPTLALRPPRLAVPRVALLHIPRAWLLPPGLARALAHWLEARYLRRVQGLVTVAHANVHWARALGFRGPSRVARPAGDHLPRAPLASLEERARRLPPLRVLFVGQLVPRKGLHVLFQALRRLPPGSWRLDVVGDARWAPAYARGWRQRTARWGWERWVRWWGGLPHPQVARLMRQAHVLAVPSWAEGYALVYIEAMAAGLPVIGSRVGGGPELITPGANGFLVDPERPDQVAQALTRLMDPERWLAMAFRALETFDRHPTWEQTVTEFENGLLTWSTWRPGPVLV